jgi:hypothetical protein
MGRSGVGVQHLLRHRRWTAWSTRARQPEAWTGGTPLTLSVASFQVFGSRAKAAWALQSGMSNVCSPRTILSW